jgi:hypothetical protein
MTYRVSWEIDIEADSARDAARKAQDIQLDPSSTATVFKVQRPDGSVAMFDLGRPAPKPRFQQRRSPHP